MAFGLTPAGSGLAASADSFRTTSSSKAMAWIWALNVDTVDFADGLCHTRHWENANKVTVIAGTNPSGGRHCCGAQLVVPSRCGCRGV